MDSEQDGGQSQEALAFRGLGMATANPGQGEIHDRLSGVADEPQLLKRRETPPRVYPALFDIARGVGSENRQAGCRR